MPLQAARCYAPFTADKSWGAAVPQDQSGAPILDREVQAGEVVWVDPSYFLMRYVHHVAWLPDGGPAQDLSEGIEDAIGELVLPPDSPSLPSVDLVPGELPEAGEIAPVAEVNSVESDTQSDFPLGVFGRAYEDRE